MAFPTVAATDVHEGPTGGQTSHGVSIANLSAVSGDLVVVIFGTRNTTADTTVTVTPPAGWTTLIADRFSAGSARTNLRVIYRVFDGSEGTSITFTTDVSAWRAGVLYRITGHNPAAPMSGTVARDTNDPPSHDAGAVREHLWLVGLVSGSGATAPPADYTNHLSETGGGATFVQTDSVRRNLNAQTEDPGAWTGGSFRAISCTLAVHPDLGDSLTRTVGSVVTGSLVDSV